MNNQSSLPQSVQQSEMQEVVQQPVQSTTIIDPSKKNPQSLIIGTIAVLLILAMMSAVGIGGYFLGKQSYSNVQMPLTQTQLETIPFATPIYDATSPQADNTFNWETYVTPTNKYQIQYPNSWTISPSPQTEWSSEGGAPTVSVSKGDYKVVFAFPTAYGPSMCIFSDSPDFSKSFPDEPIKDGSKCPGEFMEIKTNQNVYRRQVNTYQSKPDQIVWSIYSKDFSNTFVTVPPISYFVPVNTDSETLTEMDQILATFKAL